MAMEGKTLKKEGFKTRVHGKRYEKRQQVVRDQSMTMEKSWVMMIHQTGKEHKE